MVMALAHSAVHTYPKPVAEIDIELLTFVERYATNLVRWDLLLFFGGNPEMCVEAAEIARLLRRSPAAATKELDDLAYLHVLARRHTPERTTYQLAARGAARRTVLRLASFAGAARTNPYAA